MTAVAGDMQGFPSGGQALSSDGLQNCTVPQSLTFQQWATPLDDIRKWAGRSYVSVNGPLFNTTGYGSSVSLYYTYYASQASLVLFSPNPNGGLLIQGSDRQVFLGTNSNADGVVFRTGATGTGGGNITIAADAPVSLLRFTSVGGTVYGGLWPDAANAFSFRNGANGQTFRLYNTYTDLSNYERLSLGWSSNVCIIAAEAAGTGTQRQLIFKSTPVTVASLPSAATMGSGARAFVSDAAAPTWGSTVAGGGAVPCPVFSDGSNWKVG